jgi:hypothetical protein
MIFMANFMQAVKWMREGKKVRRKFYKSDPLTYIFDDEAWGILEFNPEGEEDELFGVGKNLMCPGFMIEDFEEDDWEIVK